MPSEKILREFSVKKSRYQRWSFSFTELFERLLRQFSENALSK